MTPDERAVLQVFWAEDRPLYWYNIEIRLGMKGILLSKRLPDVVEGLRASGFLVSVEMPEARPGNQYYEITAEGRRCLESAAGS